MKKIHFMLIFVVISAFLFAACGKDFEFSTIIDLIRDKNGENEQNPPVIVLPETDPQDGENEQNPPVIVLPDGVTVSVSIDYELSYWCYDVLVRLTLSEGTWDRMMTHVAMSSVGSAFAHEWVNVSSADTAYAENTRYNSIIRPKSMINGHYYQGGDLGSRVVSESILDPKVLFYRFNCGCGYYLSSGRRKDSEEQQDEYAAQNFSRHLPITVTINEEKLAEMKKYTDVTGNLVVGTKTAILDKLYVEETNLLEKYGLSLKAYIWNDYMPGGGPSPFSLCSISFDSATKLPPMEVSATIITERITMPDIELYDIYKGNGTYGKLFRKDFRPVNGFRLNDREEYTIKIIVKISGEQQTITFENQNVNVTW